MRSENTLPLTSDEHRELAAEMRDISARLNELEKLVTSVYGPASRVAFSFVKTLETLDRLRADLEWQATVDLPGERDGFYR